MKKVHRESLRMRIAREAAVLLYTSQEKEYKQAKKHAAKMLGARILPSNAEVAEHLDKLAEEIEGPSRQEMLIQMRRDALKTISTLKDFNPLLVGSVWRGTACRKSDIDIVVFHSEPEAVLNALKTNDFEIVGAEWRSVTKRGEKKASFHVRVLLPTGNEAEIVVRSSEEEDKRERCEIYGDLIMGLNHDQLKRVLKENPLKKFVPS